MSLVTTLRAGLMAAVAVAAFSAAAYAQTPPLAPDIAGKYVAAKINYDYEKRVVMIPMRDGTKLYTVIVIPKGGNVLGLMPHPDRSFDPDLGSDDGAVLFRSIFQSA